MTCRTRSTRATCSSATEVPPYALRDIGGDRPEELLDFVTILQEELVRVDVLPEDYDFGTRMELVPPPCNWAMFLSPMRTRRCWRRISDTVRPPHCVRGCANSPSDTESFYMQTVRVVV